MNYLEAEAYLNSLQFHKIKLGLGAMRAFLARVRRPEKDLKFVHVAGTNGKGSVSMTLQTILTRAGYRVGLYTSPHLSSVRERLRAGEAFIDKEKFAEIATRIKDVLGDDKITYFEFTTALAFLWFAELELDLVILETGLGGRLDATNVVVPLVSVITNVSMDHEAYLGNDLESIAYEKAGIVKAGVPVVCGTEEEQTTEVVRARCRDLGAPLYQYGEAFTAAKSAVDSSWQWLGLAGPLAGLIRPELRCAMRGSYQIRNASLALAVLAVLAERGFGVSPEDIRAGLLQVRWPGRLEHIVLNRTREDGGERRGAVHYLLDGAHNPAGVSSLVTTLSEEYTYRHLIVIWGAMADKDLMQTIPLIGAMADRIIFTRPAGERSAEPEQLLACLPEALQPRAVLVRDVIQALAAAEAQAGPGDIIVVAGSLYLIGAVRSFLVGELVSP
ncbi:MAG: bifunctional folylpolyglutamate synthase/dihydrofolate synthase [Desulfocapsaceae bacterium]|nr:bifunctional folylpolyglutamate synthase/dihydrofolate synthase [Desulfocapsaceae bacterium]